MTFDVIATGSNGNAVVLNKNILIDCGVSWKAIKPYAKDLRIVLLTHIHGDHFNPRTVRALHRERPGLRWGCCEWMVAPLLEAGVDKRVIDVYNPDLKAFEMYGPRISIRPERLTHDVPNCGYHLLLTPEHGKRERIFYATDTGTLDGVEAPGYDWYFIEANHTRAELEERARAKLDAGEFAYEIRAARNHLSQEQAEEWLYSQMGPHSQYVFLHQHKGGEIDCRTGS